MDWLDLLAVQGTLNSLLQHHSSKASILRRSAFFTVQLSHLYMTTGKTIALTRWTFVGKVMSLLFNMLSWCKELSHLKRPWCWERLKAGEEGDDRGWDGWMASPTQWTWVWVNFGSWRWTGRPDVLQSMGSQRVGHDWATELNWGLRCTAHPSSNVLGSCGYFVLKYHLKIKWYCGKAPLGQRRGFMWGGMRYMGHGDGTGPQPLVTGDLGWKLAVLVCPGQGGPLSHTQRCSLATICSLNTCGGVFASERWGITAKLCFNILLRLEKQEYVCFCIEIFPGGMRGRGGWRDGWGWSRRPIRGVGWTPQKGTGSWLNLWKFKRTHSKRHMKYAYGIRFTGICQYWIQHRLREILIVWCINCIAKNIIK